MDEDQCKRLKKQRAVYKGSLTRMQTFASNYSESQNIGEILSRLQALPDLWSRFDDVQLKLELDDEETDHSEHRAEFEAMFYHVKAHLETFMTLSSTDKSTHGKPNYLHLPAVNLPTFSGDFATWVQFRDTFKGLIVGNKSLPEVQKLHYLISSLKGEALEMVQNLTISDENFQVAWQLLNQRYNNPKLIVAKYVTELLTPPKVTKESGPQLRQLVSHVRRNLNAITSLKTDTPLHETLLIHILLDHTDINTRREWEHETASCEFPSLERLLGFLEKRCQALELIQSSQNARFNNASSVTSNDSKIKYASTSRNTNIFVATNTDNCPFCNQNHSLYKCSSFAEASVEERYEYARQHNLCFNCLRSSHHEAKCWSGHCGKCTKRHHTLLHRENQETRQNHNNKISYLENSTASTQESGIGNANSLRGSTASYCSLKIRSTTHVLLSTAIVKVCDSSGKLHLCRALLDSASQSNFITDSLAKLLNLRRSYDRMPIHGIGNVLAQATHSVNIELHSNTSNFRTNLNCAILQKITDNVPAVSIDTQGWNIPHDVVLADDKFDQPGRIDLLIGAELFCHLLKGDKRTRTGYYPVLQNTELGYILSGHVKSHNTKVPSSHSKSFLSRRDLTLDRRLQKFWEIEEVNQALGSKEEIQCEEHFINHTTRDSNGRYTVRLPRCQDELKLGDSHDHALRRLQQLEHRLHKQPELRTEYNKFMEEYEMLGHMSEIRDTSRNENMAYYLPHHAVVKASSSTTKTRVVFDASAKTTTGVSLNDTLLVGATIQQDLYSIIVRFRTHAIAFTADIEKMYRQINIHPNDTRLQRILWRKSPDDLVKIYELQTVTYGTASAPFLATRCLQQLAADECHQYPKAAEILKRDFYVDDVLCGANTVEEALSIQDQLIKLLNSGGFPLRKFCSNHPAVLEAISPEYRENQALHSFETSDEVRTFGLLWQPVTDTFHVATNTIGPAMRTHDQLSGTTKRMISSAVSSIFDPLGLISPVVICFKIFLQKLWSLQLGWDEIIPPEFTLQWQKLYVRLAAVRDIEIDRHVLVSGLNCDVQVHGFSDASEQAYGACLYLRSVSSCGNVAVKLLVSKSRVAPVKHTTLPRLELCGAVLLADLLSRTLPVLELSVSSITLWSDSTIVLSWLDSPAARWKSFVANRVEHIQDLTNGCQWRHVRSQDNPADLISRGVDPVTLHHLHLWWYGPSWLLQQPDAWPCTASKDQDKNTPEQRMPVISAMATKPTMNCFQNTLRDFSSLARLKRVIAYVQRFAYNARHTVNKKTGFLTAEELQKSLQTCIKIAQHEEFLKEINDLKEINVVNSKSELKDLNIFIDTKGCLRVGGRLHHSELPFGNKHQLILPPKHHITRLIITAEHKRLLHAGPQLLIASLRQEFWIPKIRQNVRSVIHKCVTCSKLKGVVTQQLMGQLPAARVRPARAFLNTGIDYAGPLAVKSGSVRSKSVVKCYIAVFVCLATKAIHLELVSSLTSEAFIAALRRFIARRGKVLNLYSDNATNFVGANKERQQLRKLFFNDESSQMLHGFASSEGITWHFIPPSSPHFGGLWEAGVRSLKHHLRRVAGKSLLTFEELTTLLAQIEACLNSRPLTVLCDDPNDPSYLSPGHFLIGCPLMSFPEPDVSDLPMKQLSRWQYVQRLSQQLWTHWSKDYLNSLQQRSKWQSKNANIQSGMVVLVKEDNMPPLGWRLAVVQETYPGTDGVVRVVNVKTSSGILKRPVQKLVILPTD